MKRDKVTGREELLKLKELLDDDIRYFFCVSRTIFLYTKRMHYIFKKKYVGFRQIVKIRYVIILSFTLLSCLFHLN